MSTIVSKNKEHILVCLSSSPSNEHIVQVAGQMAEVYQGRLTKLTGRQANIILNNEPGKGPDEIAPEINTFAATEYPSGAEIRVIVRQTGKMSEVCVADNGPGIPDEKKEQVFEMFYSAGRFAADNQRSMGLGLPLCREILHAHGGSIRLEDDPSGGASFTFELPIEEVHLNE